MFGIKRLEVQGKRREAGAWIDVTSSRLLVVSKRDAHVSLSPSLSWRSAEVPSGEYQYLFSRSYDTIKPALGCPHRNFAILSKGEMFLF